MEWNRFADRNYGSIDNIAELRAYIDIVVFEIMKNKSFLRIKRTRKALKRKKKAKNRVGRKETYQRVKVFQENHDNQIIANHSFDLDDFLTKNGNKSNRVPSKQIKIPKGFSLENDYKQTIETITYIRECVLEFKGSVIEISFKRCNHVDFASLFLLNAILFEYAKSLQSLNRMLFSKNVSPQIYIQISKNEEVNLKLLANQLIPETKAIKTRFIPISSTNLLRGTRSQSHYAENKKGNAATSIRKYINSGLARHNFQLNELELLL